MKQRLTIYDIKRLIAEDDNNKYFFSRKTMKFFKQTMRDFHVYKLKNGNYYICSDSWGGNKTERIFIPVYNDLNQIVSGKLIHKEDSNDGDILC